MTPLGTSWDSLFVPNRMDLESILSRLQDTEVEFLCVQFDVDEVA